MKANEPDKALYVRLPVSLHDRLERAFEAYAWRNKRDMVLKLLEHGLASLDRDQAGKGNFWQGE